MITAPDVSEETSHTRLVPQKVNVATRLQAVVVNMKTMLEASEVAKKVNKPTILKTTVATRLIENVTIKTNPEQSERKDAMVTYDGDDNANVEENSPFHDFTGFSIAVVLKLCAAAQECS